MTSPAPHPQHGEPGSDGGRRDDLAELLAHLARCWDDERRQLARTLHDNVGSSLTALSMHLTLLTMKLPEDPALRERAAQMKQLLAQIVDANRQLQNGLWNDKLEFLGVKAALTGLVAEFGQAHGIDAAASLPEEDVDCTRDQGVVLLRCAEEALANVARHARASRVDVVLDDGGDELMLTVRDDGIGNAQVDMGSHDCHGLRLLRERVLALGGSLAVSAAQPHGTALCVRLPRAARPA